MAQWKEIGELREREREKVKGGREKVRGEKIERRIETQMHSLSEKENNNHTQT